jgi:hypothetical protein
MPAKPAPKKTKPSVVSNHDTADTPHPQIIPRNTDVAPQEEVPVDLEAMLEQDAAEPVIDKKNNMLYVGGLTITIAIIALTIFVFAVYMKSPKTEVREDEAPASATEEQSRQPSPTPVVRVSDVTIEVYNGSGVAGAAAKAAKQLSDKGYTVVKTGNIKKQATTEVFISSDIPLAGAALLEADVYTLFGVSSSAGILMNSTVSARLIVGSK